MRIMLHYMCEWLAKSSYRGAQKYSPMTQKKSKEKLKKKNYKFMAAHINNFN